MKQPTWAGGHVVPKDASPEDFIFFLSKDDERYGAFSNAYREPNGHESIPLHSPDKKVTFWCVNQELHYQKSLLFEDREIANLILAEGADAGAIKQLGRQVKNYNDGRWCEVRYEICSDALRAKFSQNPDLMKTLLDTGDKIICEAARDKTWGIGVNEFSTTTNECEVKGAKSKDGIWDVPPMNWVGENLLGRCLMDVRSDLREKIKA